MYAFCQCFFPFESTCWFNTIKNWEENFILHRDPISSRETQNDYLFPLCLLEKAIMISYVIDNGYLKINIVTQLNTICSLLYDFRHGKSSKMSAIGLLGNENVHTLISKNVHTFWRLWAYILWLVLRNLWIFIKEIIEFATFKCKLCIEKCPQYA